MAANAGAPAEIAAHDLRSRVLSGFAWGMASSIAMQVTRAAVAVLLARLLTPNQYGLANMALILSSLVLAFSDLSLGTGLVQRQHVTERDKSTVFWTSLGVGITLTVVGVGISGAVASFYHEPKVQPLFVAVSFGFLLTSLQTTQASILQREMRFRFLNLRVLVSVAAGGAVGLTVATLGGGAWALVLQQLAVGAVSVILLWRFSDWRPHRTYSLRSLREFGGMGITMVIASTIEYLNRNADNLLVARYLGSAALGIYSIAYNIMLMPLVRIILPLQDALFPAYSRWQDDKERLSAVWLRIARVVAAVVVPALLGLIVVAPDFVVVVLGPKWHAAIPVLQILSGVALIQSISSLGDKVLVALGLPKTILRFTLLELSLTIPAFVLGLQWGITGVAACYAVVELFVRPVYIMFTTRALGISVFSLLRCLAGVVQAGVVMTVGVVITRVLLVHAGVGPGPRLAICIAAGAIIYFPFLGWRAPEVRAELQSVIAGRSPATSRAPS